MTNRGAAERMQRDARTRNQSGELLAGQLTQRMPAEHDLTRTRAVEPGYELQQRRLTGSRAACDGGYLAGREVVREPAEDVPWMARPSRLEALAALLGFTKLPVSWQWRPAEDPGRDRAALLTTHFSLSYVRNRE